MVDQVPRPAEKPERSEGGQVGMAAGFVSRVSWGASGWRGSGWCVLGAAAAGRREAVVRGRERRPDAGDIREQRDQRPQLGGSGDGLADQSVELGLVLAQLAQRRLGALDQGGRAQMAELLGTRGDLGQQLAAAGQDLAQRLARPGPDRGRRRSGALPRRSGRSRRHPAGRSWPGARWLWQSGAPVSG